MDFAYPPAYYDTFALRDSEGIEHATQTFPFFRSGASRSAILRSVTVDDDGDPQPLPVPVRSCWNGMVAMPARLFVPRAAGGSGLSFRATPDSLSERYHLEGSECCLIHADVQHAVEHRGAEDYGGVFINPAVRVGYTRAAYAAVHPGLLSIGKSHHGKSGVEPKSWVSRWQIGKGLWKNRLARWTTTAAIKNWRVRRYVKVWSAAHKGREEPGAWCLVNEMHVIVENGWAHV